MAGKKPEGQPGKIKSSVKKSSLTSKSIKTSESKQMVEALRSSEEKLRSIIEHSNEVFYIHDTKHQLTYSSPQSKEIFGYAPEEMMVKWTTLVTDNPMNEKGFKLTERAIKSGKKQEPYLLEIKRKDGKLRIIEINESPIKDSKGNVICISGAARDVTERKKAEAEIHESLERIHILYEATFEGIIIHEQGRILDANLAFAEMFGYSLPELIGMNGFNIVAEESRELVIENVRSQYELPYEAVGLRKDGTTFFMEIRGKTLLYRGRQVRVGVVRDITGRKKAEKELKEKEENLRQLIESSPDCICQISLDGRFISMNAAGCRLTELDSPVKIIGESFVTNTTENLEALEDAFKRASKGETVSVQYKSVNKNGREIWWDSKVTPVKGTEGEIKSILRISRDISERRKMEEEKKKLENQLLHSQKIEAVGQLAGGVAHDFNNILTAIIGYGSLFQMKLQENDPLRVYVEQILASSKRAAELVQSLLAFSRKQIINPRPIDMNEIIARVEKLLLRVIGEDIKLKTICAEESVTVMADSGQIEQVLMNLSTNARDAMPEGGMLVIETGIEEISEEYTKAHEYGKPGKYAHISVTDSGAGMDEETRKRIFEPFFTTKEVGKGTGLGLSMVYGIIKQHGGFIDVYSEPGTGTKIKIYLPVVKAEVTETEKTEFSPVEGGTETVLVAEDDEAVRRLSREILQSNGYTVIEAEDGEEAIEKFMENKEKIDILLLDVIMPKKDGKRVYEEIKKIKPDIKALFLSGYSEDLIHKKGILEEGLNFIFKPVSISDLLRKVREVLDK